MVGRYPPIHIFPSPFYIAIILYQQQKIHTSLLRGEIGCIVMYASIYRVASIMKCIK